MFRLFVSLVVLSVALAFKPTKFYSNNNQILMSNDIQSSIAKKIGVALIASSFISLPAFAVEGAAPKQSFFGDSPASSPFTINEDREDPIYSPYSPFGM